MTELEKMIRAKEYLEKLANGIDPINEKELQNDTTLNNVRLSRCFFYIADILRQVIENGGEIGKKTTVKKLDFVIMQEQKEIIEISINPIAVSIFADRINEVIDLETYRKLPVTWITKWLVGKNLLKETTNVEGKSRKSITENSGAIGISEVWKQSQYGRDYLVNVYDQNAQQFILDNLDEIIACNRKI